MYVVNDKRYFQFINQENRELKVALLLGDTLIDNQKILDRVTLETDVCSSEYTVGKIAWTKLSLTLWHDVMIQEDDLIYPYVKLKVYDEIKNKWYWIEVPFGEFKVVQIEREHPQIKVVCYQSPYKLFQETFYPKQENRQYTTSTLLDEISQQTGLHFGMVKDIPLLNDPIIIDGQSRIGDNFDGHTYGELLSQVAAALGCNITFGRDGDYPIQFVSLTQTDTLISSIPKPTIQDTIYHKTKLRVIRRQEGEDDLLLGEETGNKKDMVEIRNLFLTEETATDVLNHLQTVSYQPFEIKFNAPLHLDPLDLITVRYQGVNYNVPLLSLKYTFIKDVSVANVNCSVNTQVQANQKGTINFRISQLQDKLSRLGNEYVGWTQLEQTFKDFKFLIQGGNGYNIFQNSAFAKNTKSYHPYSYQEGTGNVSLKVIQVPSSETIANRNCLKVEVLDIPAAKLNQKLYTGFYTTYYEVVGGESYTCQFYLYTQNVRGAMIEFFFQDEKNQMVGKEYSMIQTTKTGGHDRENWHQPTLTFKVPQGAVKTYMRVFMTEYLGSEDASAALFVAEPMFVNYDQPVLWSPHENEVYSNLVTIDIDGLDIQHSSQAHTRYSYDGMNSYNNEGKKTLGIRNGGVTFYDASSNEYLGFVSSSSIKSLGVNGISLGGAKHGEYVALGFSPTSESADDGFSLNIFLMLCQSVFGSYTVGLNILRSLNLHQNKIFNVGGIEIAEGGYRIKFDTSNSNPSEVFENSGDGYLWVFGREGLMIGTRDGNGYRTFLNVNNDSDISVFNMRSWNFNWNTMYNMNLANVYANTRSRTMVKTFGMTSTTQQVRHFYKEIELINGKGIRSLPSEYVGNDYDVVSLVPIGKGSAWIETKEANYFRIGGDCRAVNVEVIIYSNEE